jgi:hypothetical protein
VDDINYLDCLKARHEVRTAAGPPQPERRNVFGSFAAYLFNPSVVPCPLLVQ